MKKIYDVPLTKEQNNDRRRKRYSENKEKMRKQKKQWMERNPEKAREYRSNFEFGGSIQEVLERDNFQCQKCGINQEQHIVIFGTRLNIHHIDGNGRRSSCKNNDIDNLVCMCHNCHVKLHKKKKMTKRWGDLIKQDDSNWKYPKIRYLVEAEIEKGLGVQKAKRKVSKDTGMSFTLIDHRYYMKKFVLSGEGVA